MSDERYHATYGNGPLEIHGTIIYSGPQKVGFAGVPESIADLFRWHSDIEVIAVQRNVEGQRKFSVYQRMSGGEPQEKEAQNVTHP